MPRDLHAPQVALPLDDVLGVVQRHVKRRNGALGAEAGLPKQGQQLERVLGRSGQLIVFQHQGLERNACQPVEPVRLPGRPGRERPQRPPPQWSATRCVHSDEQLTASGFRPGGGAEPGHPMR
jgi:hypothetical protein